MSEIEIKFLGSGSAFVNADENYQSNILISKKIENVELSPASQGAGVPIYEGKYTKKHFLYDAGSDIKESLKEVGEIEPNEIDSLFISHLHDDHAGGVEYLAFKTYFGQFPFGVEKIKMYGHDSVLIEGWDNCWKAGLQSIQGQTNTLETYFDTNYLPNNGSIDFYGTEMHPIQTVHVVDDRRIVPSYGLMIHGNKKIFISGDSQHAPNQMLTYFGQADVIFHDCEMAEYPNSVHAQFHQLNTLPDVIKSKMYLYHYSLNGLKYEELEREVLDAGFAGLVRRGQVFNY